MLPNDPKARKIVNDAIKQCVESLHRVDGETRLRAEAASAVQEKTEMSTTEFNKRVKIRYLEEKDEAKYLDVKEWSENAYEENEILRKGN